MELIALNKNKSGAQKTEQKPRKVRYIKHIDEIESLPDEVRADLKKVAEKYVFRANDYYLGLIDWSNPNDPIKTLIIPRVEELNDWGNLDASNEMAITVVRGAQHKYRRTVLLLCKRGVRRILSLLLPKAPLHGR